MDFIVQNAICIVYWMLTTFCASVVSVTLPACSSEELFSCGKNQVCNQNKGHWQCQCLGSYVFDPDAKSLENACVIPLPKEAPQTSGGGSSVTMVVFLLISVILLVSALVLVIRQYHLFHWLRQKIVAHRDSGMMYEDVMIGQDDPPISA